MRKFDYEQKKFIGKRSNYHDKGRIKTQTEYDQEVELRNLYHEAFKRGDCSFEEAVISLVTTIGFSPEIARQRVGEWKTENKDYMLETEGAKKKRIKRTESLKKKFLKRRLSDDPKN
ncbi:MAG: hypothetical protein FWG89_02300 [Treponema sp.]|nr:hypothetical protein [Treponema sp.]